MYLLLVLCLLTLTLSFVHVLHLVSVRCINVLQCLSAGRKCPNTCPCCRERWAQMEPKEKEESQAWRSVLEPYHRAQSEDADKKHAANTCNDFISGSCLWARFALFLLSVLNSGGWSQGVRSLRDESALWWVFYAASIANLLKKKKKKGEVVSPSWTKDGKQSTWVTASAKLYESVTQKKSRWYHDSCQTDL